MSLFGVAIMGAGNLAGITASLIELDGVQLWEEGCLSFPGATEEIKRAERVKVRAGELTGAEVALVGHDRRQRPPRLGLPEHVAES